MSPQYLFELFIQILYCVLYQQTAKFSYFKNILPWGVAFNIYRSQQDS